nr:hypothetical protein [Tanacetum cinerariifolium]
GRDVLIAVGSGDVDALMNRRNVGRAGERSDDAAGAEDRQPAQDAQPRVHGFERKLPAVFHADRYFESAAVTELIGQAG